MTGSELNALLVDVVSAAESGAPSVGDPVDALRQRRRSAERRRGHLAMLAFLLFVIVLQGLPSEAFGASPTRGAVLAGGAVVTAAEQPGRAGG